MNVADVMMLWLMMMVLGMMAFAPHSVFGVGADNSIYGQTVVPLKGHDCPFGNWTIIAGNIGMEIAFLFQSVLNACDFGTARAFMVMSCHGAISRTDDREEDQNG